jgi:hypothetical protein
MFPRLPMRHDLGGLATGDISLSERAPPGALCTEEVKKQIRKTYARNSYSANENSEAGTAGGPWGGRHVGSPVAEPSDRRPQAQGS